MRKWLILMFLPSCLFAQLIKLRDGKEVRDSLITYEDSVFFFRSDTLKRDFIREIEFIREQKKPRERISSEIKNVLDEAKRGEEKFKDVSGIIILDDGKEILKGDGTRIYRYHFIGKIEKSRTKDWAKFSRYFEEGRSKINVLLARTIKPDGSVVNLDYNKIKIASPPQGKVYFGKGKILSFALPDVEVGDIIECIYETDTYNPYDKKMFFPGFFFQSYEPTLVSRFTVTIPDTIELNYYTRNMTQRPEIKKINGNISYIWETRDIEPINREPFMPGYIDIAPGVLCSVFRNWDYIFNWKSKFLERRMAVTPEIESAVKKIVGETQDTTQKIAKIYHWIQKNIRYISIKGSISSGVAGHPAGITLENKFGDCIDKSILFSTMLRTIGIDAYPVSLLTNNKGTTPTEIPILYSNHAITEIHRGDSVYWLDPTGETFRYPYLASMDHGTPCINYVLGKPGFIPTPPPEANMQEYRINVEIKPDGEAVVEFEGRYTGGYEAGIRWYWGHLREKEKPHKIQQMINETTPGAKLIEWKVGPYEDLSQQFYLRWKYKIPQYPLKAGNLRIFRLPDLRKYSFEEVSLNKRKYDIVYATSSEIRQKIKLKIPEGYRTKYLPDSISLKNDYASYRGIYKRDGREIYFEDDFMRFKRKIKLKDYELYKNFLERVSNYSREEIFVEMTKSALSR